jgi:hypothetical protein
MSVAELWKVLPNVERNQYLVSSLGRVFNLESKVFVKPYLHKSRAGYYLRHKIGAKKIMTHVMVATNFPELVPKPSIDHNQVNHKDGNTLNPAAYNVEWVSGKYNIKHYQMSRYITFNGETIRAKVRAAKKKTKVVKK